ncbi:hypothetical protein [Dechloromonas sp. CZR5]|uniref:hypothetical protein n=1 Tax=Dechloromonas sp. CZR5 TaxID=2608630 RepID=UPI00168B0997|nr:hypothetical protein [Dechloromonas sp. CZR5]
MGIGDLDDIVGLQLGVFEQFSQLGDGFLIQFHAASPSSKQGPRNGDAHAREWEAIACVANLEVAFKTLMVDFLVRFMRAAPVRAPW